MTKKQVLNLLIAAICSLTIMHCCNKVVEMDKITRPIGMK